jgi:peptide/nickel transport system substrate-binding protein
VNPQSSIRNIEEETVMTTRKKTGRSGQVTRRRFLEGTAGVAASGVLGSLVGLAVRQVAAAAPGDTLRYAFASEPPTLDPHNSGSIWTFRSVIPICDTLMFQDAKGKVGPGLATQWSVSKDGRLWTFKLRSGVTFQDGTPFDAAAVKFNLDRVLEQKNAGFGQIAEYESAEVVDPATVRIRTKQPYAPFLSGLAHGFVSIVSPTAVKKLGAQFGVNPVGSGPYAFKEWIRQDHLALTRNAAYAWAPPGLPAGGGTPVRNVLIRFISEDATRVSALERDEVDVIENVPAQEVARLQKTGKYRIVRVPQTGAPWHINLNVRKPPTDDVRVRQAIVYAVDQRAIVETLFFGIGQPAYGPLTRSTFGYDPHVEALYKHDPERAKRLLEEAGWKAGADGSREKDGRKLRVVFQVIAAGGYDSTATMVQTQLQAVGIQVELRLLERARMFSDANKGEHNLGLKFWLTADPEFLRLHFRSTNVGNWNWSMYAEPSMDALLDEGAATLDQTKRAKIYSEIQLRIMREALLVPLFDAEYVNALAPRVHGIEYDRRTAIFFQSVSLGV